MDTLRASSFLRAFAVLLPPTTFEARSRAQELPAFESHADKHAFSGLSDEHVVRPTAFPLPLLPLTDNEALPGKKRALTHRLMLLPLN